MTWLDMFDFVILIIIIAVSVIASAKKKEGKRNAGTKPTAARPKGNPGSTIGKGKNGRQPAATAEKQPARSKVSVSKEGADPCHEYMLNPMEPQMHYEGKSEAEMAAAGEGVDPCHVGNASASRDEFGTENQITVAPELSPAARAIVMSEVLKRPAQRRQERRLQRHRKVTYGGEDTRYHSGR